MEEKNYNKQTEPGISKINKNRGNKSQLAFLLKFSVISPFVKQEKSLDKIEKLESRKGY